MRDIEFKAGDIVQYVGAHPIQQKRTLAYMGYIGIVRESNMGGDSVGIDWIFPVIGRVQHFLYFCPENIQKIGEIDHE